MLLTDVCKPESPAPKPKGGASLLSAAARPSQLLLAANPSRRMIFVAAPVGPLQHGRAPKHTMLPHPRHLAPPPLQRGAFFYRHLLPFRRRPCFDPWMSRSTNRMRIIAASVLAAMAVGCTASKPPVGQKAAPTAAPAPATPQDWLRPPSGSRWIAQGIACGEPWDMELRIDADQVSGTMHRGILEYSVSGDLDQRGIVRNGLAERRTPFGPVGPRFFDVELTFSARAPNGRFEAQDYPFGESCPTLFQLHLVAS